ncbi:MAG TPA: LuxR family transcriptional regulator [Candidatus Acetothermia bacterium]|nr:LuxR family transcriptional regulator [Candidatus Acetothermia bacterium]HEX32404.1 LuxR family transcriptional regulator [Candidatus Acetothermia bacterium]
MKVQAPLTKREREVLSLLGEGKASREIASLLSISEKTVEHHRQRLMEKLGIHTEIGLIAHASRLTITPS